jgi:hypothetical protein
MAGAVVGGLYEHIVLMPLWAVSPPSSLALIQPGTGVPLQDFWMPVHVAITVCLLVSLVLAWQERKVRHFLLIGLGSYLVMRLWSILFFIPERQAFQHVPLDAQPFGRAHGQSRRVDVLDMVSRAARHVLVSGLALGAFSVEKT